MAKNFGQQTKTVLITGAGGNLGEASVRRFAAAGWKVIAVVSPGKKLPYAVDGQLTVVDADLTNEVSGRQLVSAIDGVLDAVLLLAGGYQYGPLADVSGEQIKKMIALNFDTAFHVAMPAFKKMQEQHHGRIVLVGAQPALRAEAGQHAAAYAFSKSLVFQLAELLNVTGKSEITTSVLVPSILDTPQNRAAMPDADFSSWTSLTHAAEALFFLATAPSLRSAIVNL